MPLFKFCIMLAASVPFLSVMRILQVILDRRYQRLRLHSAFILYAAVVIIGSIPGSRAEVGEVASGLVLHFVTYSILAFLLFTGLKAGTAGKAMGTLLIVTAMGAFDEFVQSFLPYRTAALGDWAVDVCAGIVVTATLWTLSSRIPALQSVRK